MTVSFRAINWAKRQHPKADPTTSASTAKFVLILLAERANADWRAWPSVDALVADSDLSESAVQRALSLLKTAGLIVDTGERRGATKRIRVWSLNAGDLTGSNPGSLRSNPGSLPENAGSGPGFSNEGTVREPSGNQRASQNQKPYDRRNPPTEDAPAAGKGHRPASGKLGAANARLRKMAEAATKPVP